MKRKISVSLDEDLVAELEAGGEALSGQVNEAVRAEIERRLGDVLAAARAGSENLADAHVVAGAVETGGGLVLTGDQEDLNRLAAPYPNIVVEPLP